MVNYICDVAGGVGFEPTTSSLEGWRSIRTELLAQEHPKSNAFFLKSLKVKDRDKFIMSVSIVAFNTQLLPKQNEKVQTSSIQIIAFYAPQTFALLKSSNIFSLSALSCWFFAKTLLVHLYDTFESPVAKENSYGKRQSSSFCRNSHLL
jgi:hypothetical protein